jgi:Protein of unknown function (DUF3738)
MVRRLLAAMLLAASIVGTQAAQLVPNAPTFEDVMVAPNDSHENGTFFNYIRGRLFVTNSTLRMLIRTAYGVQASEIVGGPEWMNVDRFNIEAKGDVGNSPALPVAHAGEKSPLN